MIGVVTVRSVVQIIVRSIVQEITSFITREACLTVKGKIVTNSRTRKAAEIALIEIV